METSNPQGTGLDAAAASFERILSGQTGEQERPEDQTAEADEALDTGEDNPEASLSEDAPDDAASDEPEDEADPEDDDTEGEEGDEPLYTVKVDGKEEAVPVSELIQGYQRTKDYTLKTQALAEERRVVEQELQTARMERVQYLEGLKALEQNLTALQPQRPDFDRLFLENPVEASRIKYEWDKYEQSVATINAERQRMAQMEELAQAQQIAALVEQNRDRLLNERLPEWKDPNRAKRDRDAIRQTLTAEGFTADELDQLYDDRMVKIAWKAAQYDRMQAERKAIKPASRQAPAPIRSGSAPQTNRTVNEATRAKQRLAKTGSLRDAASVFEKLI